MKKDEKEQNAGGTNRQKFKEGNCKSYIMKNYF